MISESFDNISQRVIYPYIITYPDFKPDDCTEVSKQSQEQWHHFLKETLIALYKNPQIIGLSEEKDDCFNEEAFKDKPELDNKMKKISKKFLGFFALLYEIGAVSESMDKQLFVAKNVMPLSKAKISLLSNIGLICENENDGVWVSSADYPDLCVGWKLLSENCKRSEGGVKKDAVIVQSITRLLFMKCVYDIRHISFTHLYGGLPQSGEYLKILEGDLIDKGFTYSFRDADFRLSKQYPKKQESSFFITFDWRRKNQLHYMLNIVGFTSLVTQHFESLSDTLKSFIFYRLKTCDGCGYCTQTNKKDRKPLFVKLQYNGETFIKCPLYPWLAWDKLDEEAMLIIKELFDVSEKMDHLK